MSLVQHILVPVDFGPASAAAVTLAGRVADGSGASLTLLHAEASDAPVYFTREQVDALVSQRRQHQEQARRYLAAFGHRHTETPFLAEIVMRSPIDAITEAAKDADLIVMGTHGRRGPALWWLGSVAENMLRTLTTPVLVVHEHDTDLPTKGLGVYGASYTSHDHTLALATQIGAAIGAEVHDRRTASSDQDAMLTDIRAGQGPVLFVREKRAQGDGK
jgi:nucleotide-binding universal stress UspA family protein